MTVNVSKTKAMAYTGSGTSEVPQVVYGGESIEVVPQFKYLGIVVDSQRGFLGCSEAVKCAAVKAM